MLHARSTTARQANLTARLPALLAVCTLAWAVPGARAADTDAGFSAGISAQPMARPADIGLPLYPGATPSPDRDEGSAGATLSLWGGAFGMQLRVLKLHTADKAADVARFYRQALTSQGPVLDCGSAPAAEPAPSTGSKTLQCGTDRPSAGSYLFKVGVPNKVRIVAIEPAAHGTKLQLVRLDLRGE